MKVGRVDVDDSQEARQIADADRLHELEVWFERILESRLSEYSPVGDVAHEQLDNDEQLCGRLVQTCGHGCCR